ncbi:MAG: hypothetical protein BGO74_14095 [Burkholderiales bacterium 68-12]|nr:MAG: hypothetical protein BGO74_14095 [Burkholderiales bacterium 68-12]
MTLRSMLVIGALLTGLFFAADTWRARTAHTRIASGPTLAQQAFGAEPLQESTNARPFPLGAYQVHPVAEFAVRARILGREDYRLGREAELSPMDLALGWKRMTEPAVYQALHITQGGRWYRYSWPDQPPIPVHEIVASSSNMHMIPANPAVRQALEQARAGRYIRLQGKLVNITHPSGWRWNSSLSRTDSGAGACELVYVEAAWVE